MNQKERAKVTELQQQLEALKSQVETIGEELRALAEAEQEKFDNMPEGLQASEQGQRIEACSGALEDAASACESGDIQSALDSIEAME